MIELDNVAYSYSDGALFSDISLTLTPGSFHFLTGPSGAGKTTLLNLLAGLDHPTDGQVLFEGRVYKPLQRPGAESSH